jgi:hypothetical protein
LERLGSAIVVDGRVRAASPAMLQAVGFTPDDFEKSQIGVASTWSQVTGRNISMDQLAVTVALKVKEAEAKPVVFNTNAASVVITPSGKAAANWKRQRRDAIPACGNAAGETPTDENRAESPAHYPSPTTTTPRPRASSHYAQQETPYFRIKFRTAAHWPRCIPIFGGATQCDPHRFGGKPYRYNRIE